MNKSAFALGFGLLTLVAHSAAAAPFASDGTFALGVERLFGLEYTSQTESQNGVEQSASSTSISLLGRLSVLREPFNPNSALTRLSADYFLGPGISLGGSLMYQHLGYAFGDDDNDTGTNLILLAPRVGYGARLSDQFTLWPRLGITYLHSWNSQTASTVDPQGNVVRTERSNTSNYTLLSLDALFVFTPIEHVGFSFGPSLDYLLGRSETTDGNDDDLPDTTLYSLGLQAGLLVWF